MMDDRAMPGEFEVVTANERMPLPRLPRLSLRRIVIGVGYALFIALAGLYFAAREHSQHGACEQLAR